MYIARYVTFRFGQIDRVLIRKGFATRQAAKAWIKGKGKGLGVVRNGRRIVSVS